MARYVAFLRGVMPSNAKMPDLRAAFEAAGFTNVRTVLSSGNVAFDATKRTDAAVAQLVETALTTHLGRLFPTTVRAVDALDALIADDPYKAWRLPPHAKRVVTFLRQAPASPPSLPVEADGVRILALRGTEVFTAYEPSPKGPVFMTMIERTFGTHVTTRTWDTVRKCAKA